MRILVLFLACGLLFPSLLRAQSHAPMRIPRAGTVVLREIRGDFHPALQLLEAPAPDGDSEKAMVARMKEELSLKYANKAGNTGSILGGAPDPTLGRNFRSNNTIQGVPNDNDMAISNGGMVVSVINSNIWIHDQQGNALASNVSLDAWSLALGINGSKFDPRALYDPIHDRFIVACLNGFTDSTSWVIVGFTQTNDPTGGWNLYALPGDPRGDSLWTDYPIMALSQHELFLTANLLYNDQPWQTGFQRSLCWQLDLDSAYAGATLPSVLWDSVYFGGRPVRNLCPIQAGSMPSGPGMHFLSNRNLTAGNDTVFLMQITDTIGAPGAQFTVSALQTNVQYALPPNAIQSFSLAMATNDARWLDGFIENDMIQFVGNTLDTTTGRAAVYHGIIRDASTVPTLEGKIIGNPNGDFGYPGIAWVGMAPSSNEALIGLNYLGPNSQNFAGCGGIYFDGATQYSGLVVAKAGTGYINALTGLDRWGDYMGVQTRYNAPGVAWIAGTWGQASHNPATWIAEFSNPAIVAQELPIVPGEPAIAYPNPALDIVNFEFALAADEFLEISLFDAQGRKIRVFLKDRVRAGNNRFSFSVEPLAAGAYLLVLDGQDGTSIQKKILKD